jgi:hypothetical protein
MRRFRTPLVLLATLTATLPFLTGCPTAAVMAVQMIPTAIGVGAVAGSADRNPFHYRVPDNFARPEDQGMSQLDATIQQAECGDPESQFRLATTLRNGFNTSPNNVEIYKWYRLAHSAGYTPAGDELATLEASMSGPDVDRARQLASDWQPSTEGCPSES